MTATMRTGFFMDGDTVIIREQFGKMEIVSRFKVDEEFTYAPGTPLEGKLLCTKTGKRSWKFIYVTKRGEEHWDLEFCSKGLKYVSGKISNLTIKNGVTNFLSSLITGGPAQAVRRQVHPLLQPLRQHVRHVEARER